MKKPKKYVMDWNKKPTTECRVKDCHKDKYGKESCCRVHNDRVKGIWKPREEYIAEKLMETK